MNSNVIEPIIKQIESKDLNTSKRLGFILLVQQGNTVSPNL